MIGLLVDLQLLFFANVLATESITLVLFGLRYLITFENIEAKQFFSDIPDEIGPLVGEIDPHKFIFTDFILFIRFFKHVQVRKAGLGFVITSFFRNIVELIATSVN